MHHARTHGSHVGKETECSKLLGKSLQKEKDLNKREREWEAAGTNNDKLLPRDLAELSYRCKRFQAGGSFYFYGVDTCRQQCLGVCI